MLTNIVIVLLAIIGISDSELIFRPAKDAKPGIDVPKPSSYDGKDNEKRGGWDHN